MTDYTTNLMLLSKYNNYLIPDIPKIIAQYLSNNPEYENIIFDKKIKIEAILEYLSNTFSKNLEITENTILKLIFDYINSLNIVEIKEKKIVQLSLFEVAKNE